MHTTVLYAKMSADRSKKNGSILSENTAMDYWPDRVREKCRANRSYAIAHGLEEICTTDTGKGPAGGKRRKWK